MTKRKAEPSEKSITPPTKKIKVEQEIFADPTYDGTFKMLFGTEENKDILISILNSLLGFNGAKEIQDVEINTNNLYSEGVDEVKGSVDVLCTTKNGQKIAVEMQKKYKDYFLPRTQVYMAKMIAGQVREGQSEKYHEVLFDTYILSIGKQNIFRGKYKLNDYQIYEETIVPWVLETNEEVPGNRMHWKFYELPKFAKKYKKTVIKQENSLKEQWLDFLLKCSKQTEIPDNINDIIKKGYKIMEIANWTEEQKIIYWKQKYTEELEIKEQARLIEEAKIEGEIKQIVQALKFKIPLKNLIDDLKYIKDENLDKLAAYINEGHEKDEVEQIGQYLGLFESTNINDYEDNIEMEVSGDTSSDNDMNTGTI